MLKTVSRSETFKSESERGAFKGSKVMAGEVENDGRFTNHNAMPPPRSILGT